jgi:hypothetical protein
MRNPVGVSAAALSEYRCVDCGYGARRRAAPDRCPMCGGGAWSAVGRGVFEDMTAQLVASARRAALLTGGDADAPLVRELDEVSVFPGVPLH